MKRKNLVFLCVMFFASIMIVGCFGGNDKIPVTETYIVSVEAAKDYEYLISFNGAEESYENSAKFKQGSNVGIIVSLADNYDVNEVVLKADGVVVEKESITGSHVNYLIESINKNIAVKIENVVYNKHEITLEKAKGSDGEVLNEDIYYNILFSTEPDKNFETFDKFVKNAELNLYYNSNMPIYLKQRHIDAYNITKIRFMRVGDNFNGYFPGSSTGLENFKFNAVDGEHNLYKTEVPVRSKNNVYCLYINTATDAYGDIENYFVIDLPAESDYIDFYALDEDDNIVENTNFLTKTFSENFKFLIRRKEAYMGKEYNEIFKDMVIRINGKEVAETSLPEGYENQGYSALEIAKYTVPTTYQPDPITNKFVITITGINADADLD